MVTQQLLAFLNGSTFATDLIVAFLSLIASLLALFALIRLSLFLKKIRLHNKKIWDALCKTLQPEDLEELSHFIWQRYVAKNRVQSLSQLMQIWEYSPERLYSFGGPWHKLITQQLMQVKHDCLQLLRQIDAEAWKEYILATENYYVYTPLALCQNDGTPQLELQILARSKELLEKAYLAHIRAKILATGHSLEWLKLIWFWHSPQRCYF